MLHAQQVILFKIMKTNLFIILLFLGTTISFFACTKHSGDIYEPIPTATLTFSNLTEGAVIHTGDSVLIQGVAAASAEMHGYEVAVKNADDTAVVYFSQHVHDHGDTLLINQGWKDTLTAAANLQVEVTLTLDHDGHTSTKTVGIKTEAR